MLSEYIQGERERESAKERERERDIESGRKLILFVTFKIIDSNVPTIWLTKLVKFLSCRMCERFGIIVRI